MFDVSSTVLCAIMNCDWNGEGVGRQFLIIAAPCWVRYCSVFGMERMGGTCLILATLYYVQYFTVSGSESYE